jgi:16S rRNA (uracil1498-N3)-methyltransferase
MDFIVQKAVELGVTDIAPTVLARSVPLPDDGAAERRRARWQTIARAAAQQCGRLLLPRVHPIKTLPQVLTAFSFDVGLLAWENKKENGLRRFLRGAAALPGAVFLLVGPEGGFTAQEAAAAQEAGLWPVGLGPRVLRAETAALALVTAVMYEWADIGGADG